MLKKIVKYGNSNALVLDRAIMELIGINEGDTVKLTVNNDTLTIRPTSKAEKNKFIKKFATGKEILVDMWQKDFKPTIKNNFDTDPNLQEWKAGNKKFDTFMEKSQILMKENEDIIRSISDPKIYTYIEEQIRACKEPITLELKTKITEAAYEKHAPGFKAYWKKLEKIRKECGLKTAANTFAKPSKIE